MYPINSTDLKFNISEIQILLSCLIKGFGGQYAESLQCCAFLFVIQRNWHKKTDTLTGDSGERRQGHEGIEHLLCSQRVRVQIKLGILYMLDNTMNFFDNFGSLDYRGLNGTFDTHIGIYPF